MIIPVEYFRRAIALLAQIEKRMHYALDFGGDNPHYKVGQRVTRYLARFPEGKTFNQLFIEFHSYAKKADFEEILCAMQTVGSLDAEAREDGRGGKVTVYKLPINNKEI